MKHRFEMERSRSGFRNIIISITLFAAVLSAFLFGTAAAEKSSNTQALKDLKEAVNRGIVHCYTLEGTYPESLQYLKKHYGLTYDEDRFFVDYQVQGSNIIPEVTIMDRRNRP